MKHTFTDPDLIELDRIWPIGQILEVCNGGNIAVAGAYKGRYLHYLSEMFPNAFLLGYEPQKEACLECTMRFARNPKVRVYSYGLATANRGLGIGKHGTDGASILSRSGKVEMILVRDAVDSLPSHVELLVLNMEGYEWVLLPYLMNEAMHHRIRSMAIQFHPEYVSSAAKNRVLTQLSENYQPEYKDNNNWTYWRR